MTRAFGLVPWVLAAVIWMTVAPSLPAHAVPAGNELARALQTGAMNGGIGGLLGALRESVARTPSLTATPESAGVVANLAAHEVDRFPLADASHYGAIGAIVVAAAPTEMRADVADAVMDALVNGANGVPRGNITAQVVVAVSEVSDLSVAEASERLKASTARRPPRPKAEPPTAKKETPELGLKAGDFKIYPRVLVTELHDDNVFATSSNEMSDWVTVVTPSVFVESTWKRHYVNLEAGTDLSMYSSLEKENAQDFWIGSEGRIDLGKNSNIFGGVWHSRDHEDRESPDDVNGDEPTKVYDTQAHAGVSHLFQTVALRVGGTYQRLNYQDVNSTFGVINNDDRDRKLHTAGGRVTLHKWKKVRPFVQGSVDVRKYDSPTDDAGYDRDSNGYRVAIGTEIILNGSSSLEVYAGHLEQDYDDRRLSDPSGLSFGASLEWVPKPLWKVTAYADRTVEETTLLGASSYLYSVVGGAVDVEVARDWLVNVNALYGISEFEGVSRDDVLFGGGLGLRYSFTEKLFVEGEYAYRQLDSDTTGENFNRSLMFLRVGGQL